MTRMTIQHHITQSLRSLLVFTVALGLIYPLVTTGIAAIIAPSQRAGSLVVAPCPALGTCPPENERVVGSALIGQHFDAPHYFWGRPSATAKPYDGMGASGSNFGPSNPALHEAVAARIAALGPSASKVPVDLVTASASGLDPHMSQAAALFQVPRVAAARGITKESLEALVKGHVEPRLFGLFGERVVNVLTVNMALDALAPQADSGRR
jgi:K+-transporting ATPase ATPase C chain